jgi:hypothetical protein
MSCMCVAFALRASTYNVGRLERCASAFGASCLLSFHITSREPDHPTDYALQIVRKQWASCINSSFDGFAVSFASNDTDRAVQNYSKFSPSSRH